MRSRVSVLLIAAIASVAVVMIFRNTTLAPAETEMLAFFADMYLEQNALKRAFPAQRHDPEVLIDCDDNYSTFEHHEAYRLAWDKEVDAVRAEALVLSPRLMVIGNWYTKLTDEMLEAVKNPAVVAAVRSDHHRAPDAQLMDAFALNISPGRKIHQAPELGVDARILSSAHRWGYAAGWFFSDGSFIDTTAGFALSSGRVPTVVRVHDQVFPTAFLQALAAWEGVPVSEAVIRFGEEARVGKIRIPIDEAGYFRITRLRHPPHNTPTRSLVHFLKDTTVASIPANLRIYSYSYRQDRWLNGPGDHFIDGGHFVGWDPIALTAQAVENVIHGETVVSATGWKRWAIICLAALILAFPFAARRPVLGALGVLLGGAFVYWGSAWIAARGFLLPILDISLVVLISPPTAYLTVMIQERIARRRIRNRFAGYLSEGALRKIVIEGEEKMLAGRRKEITALFMNLGGFMKMVESLPPDRAVEIVSELIDEICDEIFKRKATLDKFVLGSLFVFLNDPIEVADHPKRAIELAQALIVRVQRFLARRPETRGMTASIGIETGEAVVGNLGSPDYVTYTAIGETVNLAARLAAWAKPGEIAVGPEAAKRAGAVGRAEQVSLKGVSAPVAVTVVSGGAK